ncbi:hypothetical protein SNL152K_6203 [Streptomyces sp. NL15-2K]|nr:hypothetical protein SNL152K_6203 [Streptomyces sp. NL15-2K]
MRAAGPLSCPGLVRREGTDFSVRFIEAQRDLVDGALLWLAHR